MPLLPPLPQEKERGRGFFCYQYAAPPGLENSIPPILFFVDARTIDNRIFAAPSTVSLLQKRRDFLNCYINALNPGDREHLLLSWRKKKLPDTRDNSRNFSCDKIVIAKS